MTSRSSHAPRPVPHAPRSADLLFEIGAEELPAAYVPGLIDQVGREATALFKANHLTFDRAETFATPRRLVLLVHSLSGLQHRPAEEVRGPSKQAAYDKDGKPTQALQGFLKSHGGAIADTKLVSSEKGAYVFLVKPVRTTPTAHVLPALLPQLIGKLRSPKTMRWDASGVRFARPIRWLLALYGSTQIRCTIGRLTGGAATWVGLPLRPKRLTVSSPEQYRTALATHGIILDHAARRSAIEAMVTKVAAQSKGRIAPEMIRHGLLDEVTYLVEQPVPLVGSFDKQYLELPREVLLASMAKHQRVFAIESQDGLAPQCVAILEGRPGKPEEVRKVVERILNARLADSLMFWSGDHKQLPLANMASALSGVTFHEKLGSMWDKTGRVAGLTSALVDAWALSSQEQISLKRAAQLAKADLVSTMVKEFPTLQGIVGKHYAKESGEHQAVVEAIEEHYLPLAGKMPKTLIGSALAILDKYDTLAGYFSIGIQPTGDQDPFGLRRAAQGIVEVGWAIHRPLRLDALFSAWQTLAPTAKGKADVAVKVRQYLAERLYTFAWPAPPARQSIEPGRAVPTADCIDAVLASPWDDLVDAMDRMASLQRLVGHPGLLKAAKVIERTRNILKSASVKQPEVNPERLQEAPERELWDVYRNHQERLAKLAQERAYGEATTLFGDLFYDPVHRFFDKVLVNVPEAALQQNRLALMQAINTLYTARIADLSKLAILQQGGSA